MIAGYAEAGQVAEGAGVHQGGDEGRRLRARRTCAPRTAGCCAPGSMQADGKPEAKLNAYLDDYAFLDHGLLNLHDATGEQEMAGRGEER